MALKQKSIFFKIAKKSPIFLVYFCKQICWQELSKIAQSGHTARDKIKPKLLESFDAYQWFNHSLQNVFPPVASTAVAADSKPAFPQKAWDQYFKPF